MDITRFASATYDKQLQITLAIRRIKGMGEGGIQIVSEIPEINQRSVRIHMIRPSVT